MICYRDTLLDLLSEGTVYLYEPFLEKTNIVDRHFSPTVDFCFRNHYSIPLRWNVSARHSLCMLIWIYTLRRVHNVGFLVKWLMYFQTRSVQTRVNESILFKYAISPTSVAMLIQKWRVRVVSSLLVFVTSYI